MSAESGPAFVDTNILVYAFERASSRRKEIASALVAELVDTDRIRLSTQVLQELVVTLTRKIPNPLGPEEVLIHLDDLNAWPIFWVDFQAIRRAVQLASEAVLSFWDALIVVSAARSDAALLYTEDLNHGQEILGVRIVNPFKAETA